MAPELGGRRGRGGYDSPMRRDDEWAYFDLKPPPESLVYSLFFYIFLVKINCREEKKKAEEVDIL
jgi:hypothetical protein